MNKIISIPSLFAIVLLLLSAQLMFAGNWSKAPASPPNNNTDTPINVGSKAQDKQGALGVNALAVFGLSQISSNMPRLVFDETDAQDWELRATNNTFNLMHDFDASGAFEWAADGPWPMTFQGDGEFVKFRNQVRANEYCDHNGQNCLSLVPATTLPTCAEGQTIVMKSGTWGCEDFPATVTDTDKTFVFDHSFLYRFVLPDVDTTSFYGSLRQSDAGWIGIATRNSAPEKLCTMLGDDIGATRSEYVGHTSGGFTSPSDNGVFHYDTDNTWKWAPASFHNNRLLSLTCEMETSKTYSDFSQYTGSITSTIPPISNPNPNPNPYTGP